MQKRKRLRLRLLAAGAALIVGASIMAVKFYVYHLTHSSAVLSDALESIINVVASAFALGSVLLAAKPPDESHPYGHGKIEFFSAGFEGALIILAAIGIFITGFSHILNPQKLPHLKEGLALLLATSAANGILGIGLIRTGKRTDSLTLVADGRHVLADVYTSAGVLLGLSCVWLTGWLWLDGTIACIVGANIMFTGGMLVRQSFAGLMDASDPKIIEHVSRLLQQHRKQVWIDVHRLRAWKAGNLVHIDCHVVLPRDFSLAEAHREAREIEDLITDAFEGRASVLVHMDPCIDADCPACSRYRCGLRGKISSEEIDQDPGRSHIFRPAQASGTDEDSTA